MLLPIALEEGHGLLINVVRLDGSLLIRTSNPFEADVDLSAVVVPASATVSQLLHAIERAAAARSAIESAHRISWRHVWRRYALAYNGARLTDRTVALSEVGIVSSAQLTFGPIRDVKRNRR